MRKKILLAACAALLCLVSCNKMQTGTNLLKNPGFEEGGGALPSYWSQDVWSENTLAVSCVRESGTAYEGTGFVTITSNAPADAKLVQNVAVSPKSIYKLSGYIKAEDIPEGNAHD